MDIKTLVMDKLYPKTIKHKGKIMTCKYYQISYEYQEFDCAYDTYIDCGECVFTIIEQKNDRRKGKRPWAKKYQLSRGL